jgi:uncharacterized protein (DUF2141 family)
MKKVILMAFGFLVAISTAAYGQEQFSVSGELRLNEEKGQMFVWLLTQDEFESGIKPTTAARCLTLKPSPQELKAKTVAFKFVDVPPGVYGIQCHQDVNMDGKQNFGDSKTASTPPLEPIAYSGKPAWGMPWWEDVSFEVNEDVSGIELKF